MSIRRWRVWWPTLLLSLLPGTALAQVGVWAGLPVPVRSRAHAFHDPLRHHMVLFDGWAIWTYDLNPGGLWSYHATTGVRPSSLEGAAIVLDPLRDRLVVYAGVAAGLPPGQAVWTLSLGEAPAWQPLTVAGTPPISRGHAGAVYDPSGDRMVLFGGTAVDLIVGPYPRSDAWALEFLPEPTWTPLASTGPQPPAHGSPGVVYDSGRDQMVLGLSGTSWFLDLSSTGQWSSRSVGGGPQVQNERSRIYDPLGDRLLVVGGCCTMGSTVATTWALPLSAGGIWGLIPTGAPSPRGFSHSTAIYDPVASRLLMHGGHFEWIESAHLVASYDVNEIWRLELKGVPTWSRPGPPVEAPVSSLAVTFGDMERRRMLGFVSASGPIWVRDLDSGWGWSTIQPSGTGGIPVAEDPVEGRLFALTSALNPLRIFNMKNDTWSEIETVDAPAGFTLSAADYDHAQQKLYVAGTQVSPLNGSSYTTIHRIDLAAGSSASWTELARPEPRPPVGSVSSLIHDGVRDRLVVLAGRDVWALEPRGSLPWTKFTYALPWSDNSVVHDVRRDRLLLFGGNMVGDPSPYVHAVPLASPLATMVLQPGPQRYRPRVFMDVRRDRVVLHGGAVPRYDSGQESETFTFSDPPRPTLACGGAIVWKAGASVPASWVVRNESATSSILSYRLDVDRDWPGFPLQGVFGLSGNDSTQLDLSVPVPDTAAVGAATLRLWVGEAVIPEAGAWCTRHLHDVTTSTNLALTDSRVGENGAVHLAWWLAERTGSLVRIERRVPSEEWSRLATVSPDAAGRVEFVDLATEAGATYDYRAGIEGPTGTFWSAETRIVVSGPTKYAFGLGGTRLVSGACDVSLTLAASGPIELAAYDVRGRRVARRGGEAMSAGRHVVRLAESSELRPGLYFIRLRQGGETARSRVIVLQ